MLAKEKSKGERKIGERKFCANTPFALCVCFLGDSISPRLGIDYVISD